MLKELTLKNFRSYSGTRVKFNSAKVLFTGANGSGKTNLLEAVFFLTMLRSFRTTQPRDLIRHSAQAFTISGRLERGIWQEELRLSYAQNGGRALNRNGDKLTRSSDFIGLVLPVAFIPEDIMLISGSAAYRRRFIDMYLSMLDSSYQVALYQYNSALQQRNAALKRGIPAKLTAAAFEPVMAESAVYIASHRKFFTSLWGSEVAELLKTEPEAEFSVCYEPDAPYETTEDYLKQLSENRSKELKRGCTTSGPQLDDFILYLQDQPMRNFASSGQRRKLAIYLKLAAYNILRKNLKQSKIELIGLVDDVTGELDNANRQRFYTNLRNADQLFFTFADPVRDEFFGDAETFKIEPDKITAI
mgnify:CR=1 FL=1